MARTTLAMLLAFAVLGLGVLVLDKTQPAPSSDTTVYVLNVPDTDVQRLDVTTFGGSTAFERADPFGWKFASDGTQADLSHKYRIFSEDNTRQLTACWGRPQLTAGIRAGSYAHECTNLDTERQRNDTV